MAVQFCSARVDLVFEYVPKYVNIIGLPSHLDILHHTSDHIHAMFHSDFSLSLVVSLLEGTLSTAKILASLERPLVQRILVDIIRAGLAMAFESSFHSSFSPFDQLLNSIAHIVVYQDQQQR